MLQNSGQAGDLAPLKLRMERFQDTANKLDAIFQRSNDWYASQGVVFENNFSGIFSRIQTEDAGPFDEWEDTSWI